MKCSGCNKEIFPGDRHMECNKLFYHYECLPAGSICYQPAEAGELPSFTSMICSRCHRPVATFERHDPDADEFEMLCEPCCDRVCRQVLFIVNMVMLTGYAIITGMLLWSASVWIAEVYR